MLDEHCPPSGGQCLLNWCCKNLRNMATWYSIGPMPVLHWLTWESTPKLSASHSNASDSTFNRGNPDYPIGHLPRCPIFLAKIKSSKSPDNSWPREETHYPEEIWGTAKKWGYITGRGAILLIGKCIIISRGKITRGNQELTNTMVYQGITTNPKSGGKCVSR